MRSDNERCSITGGRTMQRSLCSRRGFVRYWGHVDDIADGVVSDLRVVQGSRWSRARYSDQLTADSIASPVGCNRLSAKSRAASTWLRSLTRASSSSSCRTIAALPQWLSVDTHGVSSIRTAVRKAAHFWCRLFSSVLGAGRKRRKPRVTNGCACAA